MDATQKLTGLSLSLCVSDIVQGLIHPRNVGIILSGTLCTTPEEWENLLGRYADTYWSSDRWLGIRIAQSMLDQGRIIQLRTLGIEQPNIAEGHWVDAFGNRVQVRKGV